MFGSNDFWGKRSQPFQAREAQSVTDTSEENLSLPPVPIFQRQAAKATEPEKLTTPLAAATTTKPISFKPPPKPLFDQRKTPEPVTTPATPENNSAAVAKPQLTGPPFATPAHIQQILVEKDDPKPPFSPNSAQKPDPSKSLRA
eukprot:c2348_g1_i1.p2 GENE.c2348_g1_i1~~c2348_g1_i1.p2  ORF type:complete len:144 (+),score=23.03 c2348_g1_i1:886-1317(+)